MSNALTDYLLLQQRAAAGQAGSSSAGGPSNSALSPSEYAASDLSPAPSFLLETSRDAMNQLIMNYLITEGFKVRQPH